MAHKELTTEQKAARTAARLARVRDTIQNFDTLPDSAHVRLPVICALLGCSPATAWRRVRLQVFPASVKLSTKITTWRVGDIRKALSNPHPANTIDPAQHARNVGMAKRAASSDQP